MLEDFSKNKLMSELATLLIRDSKNPRISELLSMLGITLEVDGTIKKRKISSTIPGDASPDSPPLRPSEGSQVTRKRPSE